MATLSSLGGKALGQFFGAAAALRRKKPLHPRGSVVPIRLIRNGLDPGFGVPWLDDPGTDTLARKFAALREPAYASARKHRPDSDPGLPGG